MSRPAPVGRHRLEEIRASLSERDLAVVHTVARLRFLTARQLEQLHFTDHASPLAAARTARRVLERLSGLGVLARLERRVGGVRAGSASFVYRLGPVGDRLVRAGQARRRGIEPSVTFLDHTLAVAKVVVDVSVLATGGTVEVLRLQTEPASWREAPTAFARREMLKPDLFVVLGAGEFEHHWFVEVDLGSEHLPTIERKCDLYRRYYRSGYEQSCSGVFPRVLWLVPDEMRAEKVSSVLPSEPCGLFTVALSDALPRVLVEGSP